MKNDIGIIFDSIILDWLLFLSLFLILIGVGCLIRWYYHAKANQDQITDFATKSTPAFTRRKSLERRRSRRHSSLRSSVYSNQSGKIFKVEATVYFLVSYIQQIYFMVKIDTVYSKLGLQEASTLIYARLLLKLNNKLLTLTRDDRF